MKTGQTPNGSSGSNPGAPPEETRATDALVFSELRYRRLFESAQDGILILDADTGMIMDANPFLTNLLGYSHTDFLRKAIWEIGTFHNIAENTEKFKELQAKDYVRYDTLPLETSDGRLIHVEFVSNVYLVGDQRVMQCNIRDITAQLQAEKAEAINAERYRILFENSQDALMTMEPPDWRFTDCNPASLELFGFMSKANLVSHPPWEFSPDLQPDGRPSIDKGKEMIELAMQNGSHFFEWTHKRLDGEEFFANVLLTLVTLENSLLIQATVRDITESKAGQDRIEHLNRVLRAVRDINELIVREKCSERLIGECCRLLVDNRGYNSAMILLTDETGRPITWAGTGKGTVFEHMTVMFERGELPPCCDSSGFGKELIEMHKSTHLCRNCPILDLCSLTSAFSTSLDHDGVSYGTIAVSLDRNFEADAEERTLFSEMAADLAYALYVLQMNEKRKVGEKEVISLQSQLLQAQKMEAVGRLAGGVAHDFNNMLSVILGYSEMALQKVPPESQLHSDLKEIFKAGKRSSEITKQLLAFARKQAIRPKVLDLNATIEEMLRILRRLIGEDIDLAWLPGSKLYPINMDPVQVNQILTNLCVNARDAIGGIGRVTVETSNARVDDSFVATHLESIAGDFALLTVTDDGCGMEPENLKNIFEPFYTTKEQGEGTGLGLAMVYGIVKQNNGFINVYSEPGHGTSFKIYIPRHVGEPLPSTRGEPEEIPMSRGETVLLVEDEPAIMKMSRMIIETLGYDVLASESPGEAIGLVQEHSGRIHLLITDVVMPEMNGRELSMKLHEIDPEIKVLFMSGYTSDVIARRGILEDGVNFIEKPFLMRDLAFRIRSVLDQPA